MRWNSSGVTYKQTVHWICNWLNSPQVHVHVNAARLQLYTFSPGWVSQLRLSSRMEVKNNALHPPLRDIWPHRKHPNPLAQPLEPYQSSWVWIAARFWNFYHIYHTPMALPVKGLCCGKDYVCIRWHQYIQCTLKYGCSFQFWCPTPSVWGHRSHWSPSHRPPRKNRVHLQHPHIWSRKGEVLITWNETLPAWPVQYSLICSLH